MPAAESEQQIPDLAVLGMGHSGLAAAQAAVAAGIGTVGYDPDSGLTADLAAGRAPGDGHFSATALRRMLRRGFRATDDPAVLGRVRTALICAPDAPDAPDPDRAPDPDALRTAARTLAAWMRPHTTVVVEAAAFPGATEEVVRPLLEAGSGLRAGCDFHLACSPPRTDPGSRRHSYANTPRVVGGLTPACTEQAAAFYGRLATRVVRARGPREAETAKLLETSFRLVNIALVNEMAVFCHDLGVDLWDVLRCAETKPFGFQAFRPGPGVGGPGATPGPAGPASGGGTRGLPLRLVEAARDVNDHMPQYVCRRAARLLNEHGKSARGARVLLLGVTYKPDVPDQQGAPARELALRLSRLGARLSFHDPYVREWQVAGHPVPRAGCPYEAAAAADLTVLLQQHRAYDLQGLAAKARLLFDTRGATPAGAAHRL
jgi:UDP-N-acetyl-D-glucosamine dehydrogenase